MKAVLLAFLALPVASAPAAMLYEPFNYTSGQRLSGQTDTNVTPNQAWNYVGPVNTTTDPTMTTGSLSYPGVPVDTDTPGNSAFTDSAKANAARINLPAAVASGTMRHTPTAHPIRCSWSAPTTWFPGRTMTARTCTFSRTVTRSRRRSR